jgi:hypothetical protein
VRACTSPVAGASAMNPTPATMRIRDAAFTSGNAASHA